MRYENIKIQINKGIARLSFNRPGQLNAMNRKMMDEIIAAIEEINSNEGVLVAIVTGMGSAFMAGADIKEYASQTPEQFKAFQVKGIRLYEAIENAPKPWIAAVNGFALGGGLEIALSCDLLLASESAKMGFPEVFLNLVPGGGGTQRLIQRIGINRAKQMLFTGEQYTSEKLYEWGIVNYVYTEKDFDEEVFNFAEKLARRPATAIKQLKRLAHLSLSSHTFNQKIEEEGRAVRDLFNSDEAQKAIQNFIDRS